jgi:hypothetical protein
MKTLIWLVVFGLIVIGVYTLFIAAYIPGTPEAPPEVKVYDPDKMTIDDFIVLGEEVYRRKGACRLCHNRLGVRAPLLDNIFVTAAKRLDDPGYGGGATDAEGYIYESMVEPSLYVVPGYGAAGTGGTKSPMPDVSTGEICLTELEMRSVIAYLQANSGLPVTVQIPGKKKGPVDEAP